MTDHELEQALDRLPREREPGRMLEERTVRALREEGLIVSAAGSAEARPAARIDLRHRPWWRSAAAIAAGIALFAGGLSVGQMLGARQTADAFQTVFEDGDVLLAAQVQRAGSDYVAALAALSAADGGAAADTSQALEVALTALWAAANEIVRLAPDDPVTARILQGFEAKAQESADYGAAGQLLVEF
ncbi:MAG: hypothetical protein M8861_10330 [marine benthic group bacterium]|nr:hypothetical protein [Gemmatimonadota bacterium]